MYDFQGMKRDLASFRQFEPFEGHQVRALSWSPTAGFFLCVTGSAQAKVPFALLIVFYFFSVVSYLHLLMTSVSSLMLDL